MPKLTKRVVDAIKASPAGKDCFVWDGGDGALKGFGIRVKPSGAASYLVQYRNKEGRTRRLVLGKIGTLTPEEARRLARDRLGEVSKGADPSAERHAVRGAMTVAALCDAYIQHAKGRLKASTLAMDQSRIETHIKPLIGALSVRGLGSQDIERMKVDILAGKTAKDRGSRGSRRGGLATGGPAVAARTIGMLGTILEYARQTLKLIDVNPSRVVKKPPERRQRRFLSSDEIADLGSAIRAAEEGGENRVALSAIRFLLLTGFRRMEALGLPRAWVDQKGRCIRLHDSKSGYQIRAIGTEALELLARVPGQPQGKWVFPAGRGEGHFIGLPKVLQRMCDKAGLQGVTLHVLRHSFAATAAELGFSELTIAGLLGHSVSGVTARYAHVADTALIAAADRVAGQIGALLDGVHGDENVIEFVRRKF